MRNKHAFAKQATGLLLALFLAVSCSSNVFAANLNTGATIQVVHTNDIHGYYTETSNGVLGFAELKALIDQSGADLVLDAGDTYHGQAFATVEQGLSIAEMMKTVGYDAMTVGNHDWSYGSARLKELEQIQGFPILAYNVVNTTSGKSYFDQPYLVKTVTADNGQSLKVGVIGVIDDYFYSSTASQNVEGLSFQEEAAAASALAQTLRNQNGENCDVVIALTHNHDCEEFVSGLSNVDVVIAGHEHKLIDTTYADADGNPVPVVEAGYYFYNIGVLSLTYDRSSGHVSVDETFYAAENLKDLSANKTVADKASEIEGREQTILSEPLGTSAQAYPYSWEEIRTSEQEIGRIVTAAYLDRTGADVAFENAGGIRSGVPAGTVTYGDLISISPYGNTIVTKEMTGAQLLDLVEYSIDLSIQCSAVYSLQKQASAAGEDPYQYAWPSNSGSVLQFGGIQVRYDPSRPNGSRILSAEIKGAAVDASGIYTVATNNYAADNADYPALAKLALVKEYGTCEEALHSYVAKGNFEAAAAASWLTPVTNCTRAEALTLLWQAMGAPEPTAQSPFSDVSADANSYKAVAWAAEKGITAGTTSTHFSPDASITRAQAVTFLWRAAGKPTVNKDVSFSDVPADSYYADAVCWAVREQITYGTSATTFSPEKSCSDVQLETFLARYTSR